MRVEDLTGKKFGKLTPLERVGSDKWGRATWRCRCDCGRETIVNSNNLKMWTVSSCGCSRREGRRTVSPAAIVRLQEMLRDEPE